MSGAMTSFVCSDYGIVLRNAYSGSYSAASLSPHGMLCPIVSHEETMCSHNETVTVKGVSFLLVGQPRFVQRGWKCQFRLEISEGSLCRLSDVCTHQSW